MNANKINIAILGLGTIGYGVYDIINKRLSDKVKVKKIFDKNFDKNDLVGGIITDNFDDIIGDDEISIVVETLGGLDFPYSLIVKAMKAKKSIVTANKEVVANYFKDLAILKEECGVDFYFEASVGGGCPIIKNLIDVANTNDITSISGILNGTTNYVLSRLSEGLSFDDAMDLAIKAGFAERDSSYDFDGLDMKRKLAILIMIATNKIVKLDDIYNYSLKNVTLDDIKFASQFGFSIKYMASYKNNYASIEPRLVNDMFKSVKDEYNLVSVDASNYGNLKFYAKGAGRYPTANAIVNDINDLINHNKNYTFTGIDKINFSNDENEYVFYLRVKDISKVNKDIIVYSDKNMILTKNIKASCIDFSNIEFYAKAF